MLMVLRSHVINLSVKINLKLMKKILTVYMMQLINNIFNYIVKNQARNIMYEFLKLPQKGSLHYRRWNERR